MITTLDTLILLSCRCGAVMATRQERRDGLCRACADAPACVDVAPDVIAAYAQSKVHGTGIGQNRKDIAATVNAWNACTDKDAFLNQ